MRSPSSYKADSSSSLVVAFEDLDNEKLKSLLAVRHLYAFGIRATVKKWKQRTQNPIPPAKNDLELKESKDEVEIITRVQTPTQASHTVVSLQIPKDYLCYLSDNSHPFQATRATPPQQWQVQGR